MLAWDDGLEGQIRGALASWRLREEHLTRLLHEREVELYRLRLRLEQLVQENQELRERCQALVLDRALPVAEMGEIKQVLEEAWLELVLHASPKAEALSSLIRLMERHLGDRNPR